MSDEPPKRTRAWIGWMVGLLLLLYPMSMGPVIRFAKRTDVPMAVYEPFFRLCDACGPLDVMKDRYLLLWRRGILNCKIQGRASPARSIFQP
ncbi:MAG TPA: hypothetical protein VFG04_18085 [Planctomycetaceae bacterium]|jgi:hypothetical protein|nr:hypothetical protein [Planctomycetaceae bacterium]